MPHRTHSGCLEEKFAAIKGGKGIAFSLPVSDVAGLVQIEEKKQEAEAEPGLRKGRKHRGDSVCL